MHAWKFKRTTGRDHAGTACTQSKHGRATKLVRSRWCATQTHLLEADSLVAASQDRVLDASQRRPSWYGLQVE